MESKAIKLGKKDITVRELTVREIREICGIAAEASMVDRIGFILGKCATVAPADLLDHAPSDLQPLIDAMVEVNSAFFAQAAAVGMEQASRALRQIFESVSMIAFSSASTGDTDK